MSVSQPYRNRGLKAVAALCAVFVAAYPIGAFATSAVRVVDGDTIEQDGIRYRLWGIDAPEAGQSCAKAGGGTWPCGAAAIEAMEDIVASGPVACEDRGRDDYGRTLAVCRAGTIDLSREMVDRAVAWAFRRYSTDYVADEEVVRATGEGIWQAPTEPPWAYRSHRWDVAKQDAPDGCPIKGNINRKGERIYHAPWSPWYGKTRVNTAKGERWFCDEGEALAAGWRAPLWGR